MQTLVPVWHTYKSSNVQSTFRNKSPALMAILQLAQDSDLGPSSISFFPLFDSFNKIQNQSVQESTSVLF